MKKGKIDNYNITVVGSGYVGMSLSVLLAQYNDVTVLDINAERVSLINKRKTTVADKEIEAFLADKDLSLSATLDMLEAYKNADFVIVATPTDYDPISNKFDTKSVDSVVEQALISNPNCLIVIKSTIPVGHTTWLRERYGSERVTFSPEFLREGSALYDNLYPSRIIVGSQCDQSVVFAGLLQTAAEKKEISKLFVGLEEAESIKLFSNAYLAMRVSFFNELDSYALANGLDAKSIIDGVSLDQRIGSGYNNPSFGYGGYCLPKDTKQLLSNYRNVPQALIEGIVRSNTVRKDFVANEILKAKPKVVGFFGLAMKAGSDNFRFSAIQGIMRRIQESGVVVVLFEESITADEFSGFKVVKNLEVFKRQSEIIVANRLSRCLEDVSYKCFSRDVFGED